MTKNQAFTLLIECWLFVCGILFLMRRRRR